MLLYILHTHNKRSISIMSISYVLNGDAVKLHSACVSLTFVYIINIS